MGQRNASAQQLDNAEAYRSGIARTGRFLTFAAGAATIGYRMRPDPADRTALRLVRETDAGLVIRGKIGMHTSPAYAEDVYIGAINGIDFAGHRATFVVAVNAPGVTVICRRRSAREANPFNAPLSSRYDELDGQMWLDDVLIPWERVFFTENSPEPIARWLFWHQLYCWLSKAEFTLGLAFACTHAMGLVSHDATVEYLVDLINDVQTVRSCLTATELDPVFTPEGILCAEPHASLRRQHCDAQGSAAHGRDPAGTAWLLAGGCAVGSGPRQSGACSRARGVLRRRWLHGPATIGPAANGMGSCRVGARPSRVCLRAAFKWRRSELASSPSAQLQSLR